MSKFDLSKIDNLSVAERIELLELLEERQRQAGRRRIDSYYPEEGPLRRELYPKHMEFFEKGATFRERCFMAANRVGKTEGAGGYEMALHLTGQYPKWWVGRRFKKPIRAWAAGKTNETTRDIVQAKLFGATTYDNGRKTVDGTGLILGNSIDTKSIKWKSGVNDLIDNVKVKHISGGSSHIGLKSYQQGRGSFEGTEQEAIWLDEEPPMDIYGECLIRTLTTGGIILMTFTPLEGMTESVMQFMPQGKDLEILMKGNGSDATN